jgi:hypothetical protein
MCAITNHRIPDAIIDAKEHNNIFSTALGGLQLVVSMSSQESKTKKRRRIWRGVSLSPILHITIHLPGAVCW